MSAAAMDQEQKLQWVKKRDGRVVPFEKAKIALAIHKALQSTGKDDQLLAQEMAEAVTLYLQRGMQAGVIPDIESIQDYVERVLIEMKLVETAKAYILYRDKRARLREAMAKGVTDVPLPVGKRAGTLAWDRSSVLRALVDELGMPRMMADRVADIVEEKCLEASRDKTPPDQLDFTIN